MKLRVLIGLLIVSVLCVSQVTGQCSDSATASCSASGQKTAAACSSATAAKLASTDGASAACCPSKTQTTAQLASLTDKPSACCASKVQATATTACASTAQATACSSAAPARLASLTAKPASACASTTQANACSSTAAAKLAKATPACPMQAAGIELCAQQQAKMQAILTQARKDLLAVLNSEQQAKFAKFTQGAHLSLMPVVLGQQASLITPAATSTQACCASKTAAQTVALTTSQPTACSGDCEKACCSAQTTTVAEQKTCPIMKSSPIKKSVFTVYQGKKVYFCCQGCDKKFNENPEKYTQNLPQFGQ